ncbi:7f961806-cfc2-4296-95a7-1e4bad811ed1 [Thermothielavioides terrestris]|uniref:7f961806-cfc2-4296-95a7-1e4bad811ed1 n=1 Tax=Thermothielavioides terrestris TaxID=2587410 RepID=A0A446BT66_9PEZI|nr:7f961806-cfc2-4296-95a7-1e4bad811ed1 [Thermothielavioides terrestris]
MCSHKGRTRAGSDENSPARPDEAAIKKALEAAAYQSTAQDIRLAIFCDASFKSPSAVGGYGVSFRRYAPGEPWHGEEMGLGWPIEVAADNSLCEMVAIIESLVVARREVSSIAVPRRPHSLPLSVSVTVFSDSKVCLDGISRSRTRPRQHGGAFEQLFCRLEEEEAKLKLLRDMSGIFVSVEYAWVPGHCIEPHDRADLLAKTARKTNKPVWQRGDNAIRPDHPFTSPFPFTSVFPSLRPLFVAHRARESNERTKTESSQWGAGGYGA